MRRRNECLQVFPNAPFDARGKSSVEGFFDPPYYEWFQYERVGLVNPLESPFFNNSTCAL